MWKRSSKKSVLPTTTTTTTAAASSSSSASASAPPPKNPKRHRRPNLGTSFPAGTSLSSSSSALHGHHHHHHGVGGGVDPNSVSCTSFLLGGTYYPGKDKTPSQSASHFLLRKKSIWYRIFCSSPPRMCITACVVIYVVFWYVIGPAVGVLLGYGRLLAGGRGGGGAASGGGGGGGGMMLTLTDLDLDLQPLDVARADAMRLYDKLREVQRNDYLEVGGGRRASVLEKIVPNWVHRNDPGAEGLVDGAEEELEQEQEPGAGADAGGDANEENAAAEDHEQGGAEEDGVGDDDASSGNDDPDAVSGDGDDGGQQRQQQQQQPEGGDGGDDEGAEAGDDADAPPGGDDANVNDEEGSGDDGGKDDDGGRPEKKKEKEEKGAVDRLEGSDDYSAADDAVDTNHGEAGNSIVKKNREENGPARDAKKGSGAAPPQKKGEELPAKAKQVSGEDDDDEVAPAKDGGRKKAKPAAADGKTHGENKKAEKKGVASSKLSSRVQRTLHNMYDAPSQSSCPSDLSPDDLSTTLVIQSSFDRLNLLLETCHRWDGPIVLALYLQDEVEERSWSGALSTWGEVCPQMTVVPHVAAGAERESARAYPVNRLRNVGLDAVMTSHVMVMDVDYVPSVDLRGTVQDMLEARHRMGKVEGSGGVGGGSNGDYREALVVPAFERKPPEECETIEQCLEYLKRDANFLPRSIDGLRDCVERKDCIVFQSDVNWEGHHTTHSERWLKGDWYEDGNYREPPDSEGTEEKQKKKRREKIDLGRKIKKVECFDSLRYEPWVVLRWCPSSAPVEADAGVHPRPVAPYYDERFHGYGKNKIEMIAHLRFLGYSFSILPLSFIVHQPHPQSKAKRIWVDADKDDLHYEMDALYPKFLRELATMYDGGKNAIPTCDGLNKKNKAKNTKKKKKLDRDGR